MLIGIPTDREGLARHYVLDAQAIQHRFVRGIIADQDQRLSLPLPILVIQQTQNSVSVTHRSSVR